MYVCEKSPPPHESSFHGLSNFPHLNLFHVNVICKKNAFKKSQSPFSFFGTPIMNGPNLPILLFLRY